MLGHLELTLHLQVQIQDDDSSIYILTRKEDFCCLLMYRTPASVCLLVCHQRYIHFIVSQDYCHRTCHSSKSF